MPSLLSCSLSLNLLALWAYNTTISCCNLWTILNIKLNNTELNNTLWNFVSQTFNNRPHNGVQMPCLLHPLAELPPFSLTSKVNPIDNPSKQSWTSFEPLFTQHFNTWLVIWSKWRLGIKAQNDQHGIEKEPDLRSRWWRGMMWGMLGGRTFHWGF